MKFFEDLKARGIVNQVTDEKLGEKLDQEKLTLYVGIDPTAETLHIGNLLGVVTLRRFQKMGHRPIALVGGATGLIGDPGGKSQERPLLSVEQVEKNVEGIKSSLSRFISFDGKSGAEMVNNATWFKDISFLEFLRDVGKHFTVNHMVAKESVRSRLEDREGGISYTEFSYMLLQAYDFFVLNQEKNCTLQFGGSDQWGNITAGCGLIRRIRAARKFPPVDVYGLTHPLVTKSDGTKYGKTEKGSIWLDPKRTSPYDFYQFFVQIPDEDIIKLLNYFSERPLKEIQELNEAMQKSPEKRIPQNELAAELTELVHGKEGLNEAQRATKAFFSNDEDLSEKEIETLYADAPSTEIPRKELSEMPLIELLVKTGLSASKGAARRDMQGGGIYVAGKQIKDITFSVGKIENALKSKYLLLRKGKKTYHVVVVK